MKCEECRYINYCEVCGKPIYPNKLNPFQFPNIIEPNRVWCGTEGTGLKGAGSGNVDSAINNNKNCCGDNKI